ncbi:MAG TPA: hypothetical protein PLV32_01555 [Chitinophagaceae bacterium]|nr:hypothetical protein [Chitinophagaceae bacterium]
MLLHLSKGKKISDVQKAFTDEYPYLKLEFSQPVPGGPAPVATKKLPGTTSLKDAGLNIDGFIDIQDDMTVSDLEKILYYDFGLNGQVSRQSGKLWLETRMTDKWTLEKQNEHGRELTAPSGQ